MAVAVTVAAVAAASVTLSGERKGRDRRGECAGALFHCSGAGSRRYPCGDGQRPRRRHAGGGEKRADNSERTRKGRGGRAGRQRGSRARNRSCAAKAATAGHQSCAAAAAAAWWGRGVTAAFPSTWLGWEEAMTWRGALSPSSSVPFIGRLPRATPTCSSPIACRSWQATHPPPSPRDQHHTSATIPTRPPLSPLARPLPRPPTTPARFPSAPP